MAVNRGKDFEDVIRKAIASVPNVSIVRLQDPMAGYLGSGNACDFIVYRYPNQFFIECKTIHGNTFPLSNISYNQWTRLLEVSHIRGVVAGIICWWVDKDVTMFMPIQTLSNLKFKGAKSVRFDYLNPKFTVLKGTKKRVFFDYDMKTFFSEVKKHGN